MFIRYEFKKRNVSYKRFFESQLSRVFGDIKCKVIECVIVGKTAYIAMEQTCGDIREVHAEVIPFTRVDEKYFNIEFSIIGDMLCPNYYDCPESILNLLTDTDNQNALVWRAKCRENIKG